MPFADLTLFELVVILGTLCLAGVVKGSLGLGVPIVSVPVLATILGLPQTIALLVVPLIVSNFTQIWQFRAHRSSAGLLVPFLGLAIIGIFAGTAILVGVPERILYGVLAAIIFVYIAMVAVRPNIQLSAQAGYRAAPVAGLFSGMLQGATGISAPISLLYMHSLRWEREIFIFAVSVMFMGFGLVQTVSLSVAGIMTPGTLLASTLITVPVMALMPLGAALGRRFSTEIFQKLVLGLLGLLALRMLLVSFGWAG